MIPADEPVLDAWRINGSVTSFLVEHLPAAIWSSGLPNSRRRTVRSIAAHLHNIRCMWMRSLAVGTDTPIPNRADPLKVTPDELSAALEASAAAVLHMLEAGQRNAGTFPGVKSAFIWGAWPRNVALFTSYALSHEAHHRGQLLLMARELGHRVPADVVARLWQWSSHLKHSRSTRSAGD